MLKTYLENLEKELKEQNYFDVEDALRQTNNQIRRLKKIGKSEDEIIEELGPIQNYIDNLYVDNCPKSKNEILMNDIIFWGVATPVAILCTIAMIFIAILCGISSAIYIVKCWIDPVFTTVGMKIGGFVLSICGLVMFGLTGLLTYKIALKMRYGILRHLRLKKYSMQKIADGDFSDDDED